jgi:hypothetical protein
VDIKHLEGLRKRWSGPMSEAEIQLLRDVQAFISFAVSNGLSFPLVVGTLGHDLNGLQRYGFNVKTAEAEGFVPQVTGYSQMDANSVGQSEEPVEST